jgi:hypothetical protein
MTLAPERSSREIAEELFWLCYKIYKGDIDPGKYKWCHDPITAALDAAKEEGRMEGVRSCIAYYQAGFVKGQERMREKAAKSIGSCMQPYFMNPKCGCPACIWSIAIRAIPTIPEKETEK